MHIFRCAGVTDDRLAVGSSNDFPRRPGSHLRKTCQIRQFCHIRGRLTIGCCKASYLIDGDFVGDPPLGYVSPSDSERYNSRQMQLPQELVEDIVDRLSDDRPTLEICSLVATTWLPRSKAHIFNRVFLNSDNAKKWCSAVRPGPDGPSHLVRTLSLQQAQGYRWLGTKILDEISDHFSSFRRVENLSITWLDLGDFEPGSLTRHFVHFGSSLRSLRLSYICADSSALIAFIRLFPNLEDLLIHTPDLCDDSPPSHVSRPSPPFHGSLNLLSFDSSSSPFVSHLAGLDLRFSSISAFNCDFSSGLPLNDLLGASSSSLHSLELEYITFCAYSFPFCASRPSISFLTAECVNVSLMRCENLQDVTVGAFEEARPPSLLFSLLSTLCSYHIKHLTVDFTAMPGPHWPEWKAVDSHLLQMAERCGLEQGPEVVLRTRLGMPGDAVDVRQLLPMYLDIGQVRLRLNSRDHRDSR